MNGEPQITLKVDKQGRLCAWSGNVSSQLHYDQYGKLVVNRDGALCRLTGHEKDLVMSKLPKNLLPLVEQGFAVVMTRKDSFL